MTLLPSDREATSKTGSRKMAQAVVCDEKCETRIITQKTSAEDVPVPSWVLRARKASNS